MTADYGNEGRSAFDDPHGHHAFILPTVAANGKSDIGPLQFVPDQLRFAFDLIAECSRQFPILKHGRSGDVWKGVSFGFHSFIHQRNDGRFGSSRKHLAQIFKRNAHSERQNSHLAQRLRNIPFDLRNDFQNFFRIPLAHENVSALARLRVAENKIHLIQDALARKFLAKNKHLAVSPKNLSRHLFLQLGRRIGKIGSCGALHDNRVVSSRASAH
ncbi:hypothetical protein CM49_05031 [Paenibacillus sp. P1XP2]|nr:hypothetical protein CM49_05031 [Paenibacillus sp. P1XP2]